MIFSVLIPKVYKSNLLSPVFVWQKKSIRLINKKSKQIKTMNRRDVDSNVEVPNRHRLKHHVYNYVCRNQLPHFTVTESLYNIKPNVIQDCMQFVIVTLPGFELATLAFIALSSRRLNTSTNLPRVNKRLHAVMLWLLYDVNYIIIKNRKNYRIK